MVDFKECANSIKEKIKSRFPEDVKQTKGDFFTLHGGGTGKQEYTQYYIRTFNELQEEIKFNKKGLYINLVFFTRSCSKTLQTRIIDAWKGVNEVKDSNGCYEFSTIKDNQSYCTFLKINCGDWTIDGLNEEFITNVVNKYAQVIEIHRQFKDELHFEKVRSKSAGNNRSKSSNDVLARNLIYFGAPGTGKSHQLKQDVEAKFGKNYERVTFYPTYSYQQFVGAYKPFVKKIVEKNNQGQDVVRDEITYKFVPGPLMRLLVKAWKAEEALKKLEDLNSEEEQDIEVIKKANRFVLIVEELNRAEAAAVFGDFFQLLDRDENNGKSEYEISIPEELKDYLEEVGVKKEKLYLPENLFIWATMNNADQGVTPLDTAFKRRWEFEYIGLDDGEDELKTPEEMLWNELRMSINEGLRKLAVNEDKLLGPFFMKAKRLTKREDFWTTFCDKVVLYLYEDAARLRRKDCFKKANVTYSELRKAFTESIKDLDTCKKVLSEHFNFEMTLSVPWPWTSETDSKDNASEPNASAEDASGETSGAQGESTSDNL